MRRLAASLLLLSTLACGSESNELTRVPIEALADETARAVCAHALDCCTSAELSVEFSTGLITVTDEATCLRAQTAFHMSVQARTMVSLDDGRVTYDPEATADCLNSLRALACDQTPVACVATPLQAAGAPCSVNDECITAYCEGANRVTMTDGTCRVLPATGQPCPDGLCGADSFCDFGAGEPTCTDTLTDGSSCWFDEACRSGSCPGVDNDTGTQGTCTARAAVCDGQ